MNNVIRKNWKGCKHGKMKPKTAMSPPRINYRESVESSDKRILYGGLRRLIPLIA